MNRTGRGADENSRWLFVYEFRKSRGSVTQLKKAMVISG